MLAPNRSIDSTCEIALTINGTRHVLQVEANERLIDVLRERLALTGAKEGCGVGVCGACTVLADGKTISSCLTLAVAVDGAEILTIEGLATGQRLHPLQKAFIDYGALQCGFCTPGQILAAKALLEEHPEPSEEEIKHFMLGNLCRCTGYYAIIEAIKAAAKELREVSK